jgi:hypothetical protein
MRLAVAALIICISLLAWAAGPAVSQSIAPTVQPVEGSAGQSDAPEKHAKRTACLKDAKSKKLVGAQRTAYVKDCMAANSSPESQASASSASP